MISMLLRGSGKIGGRSRTRTYDPLIKSSRQVNHSNIFPTRWTCRHPPFPWALPAKLEGEPQCKNPRSDSRSLPLASENNGIHVTYRRLYSAVLDGAIPAIKDESGSRWVIKADDLDAIASHFSSLQAHEAGRT